MKTIKTVFGMLLVLILAAPFALAQETADETVVIQGGDSYPVLTRAMDRVRLAFTLNAEKKLELMSKIQEKRQLHYNFLLAKGKNDQAEKFKQGTAKLGQKFEQQRTRIQERAQDAGQGVQSRVEQQTANKGAEDQLQVKQETAVGEGQPESAGATGGKK